MHGARKFICMHTHKVSQKASKLSSARLSNQEVAGGSAKASDCELALAAGSGWPLARTQSVLQHCQL